VVPAVNHLIDLGIAAPDRVCLIGHSKGGYDVLALITQTSLFCAAVASAGMVNLMAYGTIDDSGSAPYGMSETGIYACGGTPWERRDAYIENSPFFHLDRVRTPLLVISGTADGREEMQAKQTFGALRRLNRRVELRLYRGEGHSPSDWTEENMRDVTERILAWFDTFAPTE
jgi:dipeptidyl aminopeptidase/acylaminoacyl peptidase